MTQHEETKRTASDYISLWATAGIVAVLLFGYFLIGDELHFDGKWRLYLLLNLGFCFLISWRFREWFRHWGTAVLLVLWLIAHLVVYAFLTNMHFNAFFYIFSFPIEAALLGATGQILRAKRREEEIDRKVGK
jgi:hypothetical protein